MVKRYAVCGLSNRGIASFALPLIGTSAGEDSTLGYGSNDEDLSEHGKIAAVVDADVDRAQVFVDRHIPDDYGPVEVFGPDQYVQMLQTIKPDAVIIASPDDTHIDFILPALEHDIDVITEKPMVATAAQAQQVLGAEQASEATVTVTHNFRYTARHRQIKKLISEGAIGRPIHVSLDYYVDIRHGASYFLRWNRERVRSGGLSIHKSTHHLDLVNWWLGSQPQRVYALGGRDFYGPNSPHRPVGEDGQPLIGDALRATDPYYTAQRGSGAFPESVAAARNGLFDLPYNVQYPAGQEFSLYDDAIDIEDHYSALISYDTGASLAYSINFSSPWEGYRLIISGTHGQIETQTGRLPGGITIPGTDTLIHRPIFGEAETLTIEQVLGGHEGADPLLRQDLFIAPSEESIRTGLVASSWEGAVAVAAGEAIWRSIETGEPIDIADLISPPDGAAPIL